MTEIGFYNFVLSQKQEGYLQFQLEYALGGHAWRIDGMGWMAGEVARYYLRNLFKNKKLANRKELKHAGIILLEGSLCFEHQALDQLTKEQIETHWSEQSDPNAD